MRQKTYDMTDTPRRVTYLVNQYPYVSLSFVRREILALEAMGLDVQRVSIRGWDTPLAGEIDFAERKRTRYLLKDGALPLLKSVLFRAVRTPGRFATALRLAWTMSRGAVQPLPWHLVYLAEACRLLDWMEDNGTEHLHAHFATNAAEVACLARALGGPRWSYTSHGPAEADDGPRLHLATKVGSAAFVVAISSQTRSLTLRRIPLDLWSKVHVVHCGLPERAFADTPRPEPAAPTFLFIGRLVPQKAPGLLLDAFAALHAARPEARLVLAGDGEMRGLLDARIAALGLGEAVRITGWIDADQVRAELDAATAFALPSFNEGLPVVIMEALARGRPVISTYIAGIPELVTPEVGWLVPAGDVDSLTAAMTACLDAGPGTRAAMGRAGQARVRDRHLVTTEAARLAALIEGAGEGP